MERATDHTSLPLNGYLVATIALHTHMHLLIPAMSAAADASSSSVLLL